MNPFHKACVIAMLIMAHAAGFAGVQDVRDTRLAGRADAALAAVNALTRSGVAGTDIAIEKAMIYLALGQLDQAATILRRDQKLYEQRRGRHHPAANDTWIAMSLVFEAQSDFRNAEYGWDRARISMAGSQDPRLPLTLARLGRLWHGHGDFEKAEVFLSQALELVGDLSSPLDKVLVLRAVARCRLDEGKTDQAASLLDGALKTARAHFGVDHFQTLQVQLDQAEVARVGGQFDEAMRSYTSLEPRLKRVLDRRQVVLAVLYHGMADVAVNTGNDRQALNHATRAADIFANHRGETHPDRMENQLLSADIHLRLGGLEEARRLLDELLKRMTEVYDKPHLQTARAWECYAKVHNADGNRRDEALALAKAREIKIAVLGESAVERLDASEAAWSNDPDALARLWREVSGRVGEDHPYALALRTHLGRVLLAQGRAEDARHHLDAVLRVRLRDWGDDYAAVVQLYQDLCLCWIDLGRPDQAAQSFRQMWRMEEAWAESLFGSTSETEKLAWYRRRSEAFSLLFDKMTARFSGDEAITALLFEGRLRRKGWVLEHLIYERRALAALSPEDHRKVAELHQIKAQLGALLDQSQRKEMSRAALRHLGEVNQKRATLEDQVRARLDKPPGLPPDLSALVRARLPAGSALLEFVLFGPRNPRYGVFVLEAGRPLRLVILGDAGQIDADIRRTLAAVRQDRTGAFNSAAGNLTARLQPLLNSLDPDLALMVALEGAWQRLPLEVLPVGDGFLVESRIFSYLNSGRQLVQAPVEPRGQSVLVFANPEYGPRESRRFVKPLPQSGMEGVQVVDSLKRWEVSLFQGEHAAEAILKAIKTPPYLIHLATHSSYSRASAAERGLDLPLKLLAESGVALAGVNQSNRQPQDGWLSALEAADLNLSGTALVVLSSCSGSDGEVIPGEGVFGLRRAFQIAGAGGVISAAWLVDETQTRLLFEDFYRRYPDETTAGRALRQAVLRRISALRSTYGHALPKVWGAFTYLGIDRR